MKAAQQHIGQLNKARQRITVKDDGLIEGQFHYDEDHILQMNLEPSILEWLRQRAEEHNAFIMPLADLDLEGNAKPAKVEKPRKGLLKRIFSEIGR